MEPRGLRNNNPGNIRISGTVYRGEVTPSGDRAFKTFRTAAYGYRAMFVILHTYHTRRGCRTIRRMIGRWAPPGENRTDSYVRHVSSRAGFPPDREVDISDRDLMVSIVAAMSWVENGREAALDDVRAGWELYREDRG